MSAKHPVDIIIDAIEENQKSVPHYTAVVVVNRLKAAGFVIVPQEATEAMASAGYGQLDGGASMLGAYRAMVDAVQGGVSR
jgi:hypothetical protein